jgi:thiamine-phosphate pyrophosphorylase
MDRSRLLRIVDANLNRAREALRVLEEVRRLGADDAERSARLKALRHGLSDYESALGIRAGELASSRDPVGDVGRVAPSGAHPGEEDLLRANARRLQEALRVLEETGRLLGAGAGIASAARFDAYEAEKRLLPGYALRARLREAALYFVLNADGPGRDAEAVARAALRGGIDVLQLRAFPGPDVEFLDLARRLGALCREAGVLFVVNDRADVAALADADGVHVGQGDLPVAEARTVVGWSRLVGRSTHSTGELTGATGSDYVGVGVVFPTPLKPHLRALGPAEAADLFRRSPVPAFPIGGIGPGNVGELTAQGVYRAAAASAIGDAPDPESSARAMKTALESARPARES